MPVWTPDPDLYLLTTPERVGAFLAQEVDGLNDTDEASLWQACNDATGIVLDEIMRDDIDDLAKPVQASVVFVATKVAARIYRNPNEVTVDSLGDASHTYVDPRILTSDERRQLRRARTGRLKRGTILIGASDA